MKSQDGDRAQSKYERDSSHSRDRSRSRDNRVQLVKEDDQDGSYARVDHFAKNKNKNKPPPPIPKEVLQIEEELFKIKDENAKLQAETDKQSARVKAIELFSSDVLRRYDRLEHEYVQLKQQYEELSSQDWSKNVIILKNTISELRHELAYKESQFQDLKKRMQTIMDKELSELNVKAFFERQINDLMYAKKVIAEYEKRENEWTKRWNELLNENSLNLDKVNGLQSQLNRQRDTYQSVLAENDRRLAEANDIMALGYDEPDKRKAAEFLVTQIELLKEERRALLEDNDILNAKVNDLLMENDDLRHDNQTVEFLRGAELVYGNRDDEKMKRMYKRVEELEDLLLETKQKTSISQILELESQIASLNEEITQHMNDKTKLTERLEKERNNQMHYFDETKAIEFFTALLKEKDDKITSLDAKISKFNSILDEKDKDVEKAQLERDATKKEVDSLKNKLDKYMDLMKTHSNKTHIKDERSKWILDEDSMAFH